MSEVRREPNIALNRTVHSRADAAANVRLGWALEHEKMKKQAYLQRRVVGRALLMLPVALLTVGFIVICQVRGVRPPFAILYPVLTVWSLVWLGLIFSAMRCPDCGKNIAVAAFGEKLKHCPHCDSNWNEDMT